MNPIAYLYSSNHSTHYVDWFNTCQAIVEMEYHTHVSSICRAVVAIRGTGSPGFVGYLRLAPGHALKPFPGFIIAGFLLRSQHPRWIMIPTIDYSEPL